MATRINRVTVGNDFTLKVKVGLVQYDNNDINWTYMDLSKCRDIKFNISCTAHNIDIDLDYEIDEDDSSIISALVKAEYLHKNSIYNFSITGLDEAGYRWTYISPRSQSFVTTDSSQDSYGNYTELSFTAGMIMPLAPAGQDGFTPYIGENGNWFINGQDTGHSSVGEVDLSDYSTTAEIETMLDSYYTKTETDTKIQEAIDDIDLPSTDLSNYYTKDETDQKYNDSLNYTETRVNQQAPVDCTGTINDIFADTSPTTNITRWDQVIQLWEVSHNEDYRYHGRGRYYDCDIDVYLDKDETTQHNIATYRFWHPIENRYYTITIEYDYNNERGNLLSCTYQPGLTFVNISQSDYDTLLNNGQIDQNTVYMIQ